MILQKFLRAAGDLLIRINDTRKKIGSNVGNDADEVQALQLKHKRILLEKDKLSKEVPLDVSNIQTSKLWE